MYLKFEHQVGRWLRL